jgi:AraC-like DNA-binding protein
VRAGEQFGAAATSLRQAERQLDRPWTVPSGWVPVIAQHRDVATALSASTAEASELVADALAHIDNDALRVDREPQGIAVTWTSVLPDHPTSPLIAEFAIGIILTEARWVTGRRLVPARVELPQAAPKNIDSLVRLYGTDRIEFEADRPSITFSYADGARRLPKADPALAELLRNKARLTLDTSRPVLGWLDTFRDALEAEIATGTPDLKNVARRLTVAPRTLQRRLDHEGTSWRDELDRLRQARVDRLLKETELSVEAIAPRVGYSDPRTLRRSISRWYGHGAATVGSQPRR